jgi:hypothetical protein
LNIYQRKGDESKWLSWEPAEQTQKTIQYGYILDVANSHQQLQSTTMDELYHRLNALALYARSPLQHLAFEPGMNWWWIYPSNNLREKVKDSVHLLEQVVYTENEQSLGKAKLSVLLDRKFGDKFSVVPYNKKLFVTVIGLAREDQADCPLPSTLVQDQGEDKNNK